MHSVITMVGEVEVAKGKEAEFKALFTEVAAAVEREEPGMMMYRVSSADDRHYTGIEIYRDSDAVLAHLKVLGPFVERIMSMAQVKRLVVSGPVSPAAREALTGFGPTYQSSIIGFHRG